MKRKIKTVARIVLLTVVAVVVGLGFYSINAERLTGNALPMPFGFGSAVVLSGSMDEITVPEGELFCMGDNRRVSLDSRDAAVGCVNQDEILGKVFIRLYPFSEISTF